MWLLGWKVERDGGDDDEGNTIGQLVVIIHWKRIIMRWWSKTKKLPRIAGTIIMLCTHVIPLPWSSTRSISKVVHDYMDWCKKKRVCCDPWTPGEWSTPRSSALSSSSNNESILLHTSSLMSFWIWTNTDTPAWKNTNERVIIQYHSLPNNFIWTQVVVVYIFTT